MNSVTYTGDMEDVEKMKIAMVGESGVGKTCLINRYVNNVFEATDATTASSFKSRNMTSPDGTMNIRQMIWDTAGQEVYRSLASFYYRDADAVILVYDITIKKTFDELSYWLGEINQHSSKGVLLTIAGNKSDRIDDEQVDIAEAKEFAKNNGASYFLVSAKENSNITEMYAELGMRKFPELKSKFGFVTNPNENANPKIEPQSSKKSNKKDSISLTSEMISEKGKKQCC